MAIVTYTPEPARELASNLWLVTAKTSQKLDRKMAVAKGADGTLFVHDPLWLPDDAFARLDAWGRVGAIFVPSWLHDFDAEAYAARYPGARLCGPPAAVKKLKWPGLVEFDASMAPSSVSVAAIPGVKSERSCAVTHPEGGVTLIVNDALFNMPHRRGAGGLFLRLLGSTGPLHMSRLGRMFLLTDRAAYARWLREWAARTDLRHVVMAHGHVVSEDVPAALAAAAARLEGTRTT